MKKTIITLTMLTSICGSIFAGIHTEKPERSKRPATQMSNTNVKASSQSANTQQSQANKLHTFFKTRATRCGYTSIAAPLLMLIDPNQITNDLNPNTSVLEKELYVLRLVLANSNAVNQLRNTESDARVAALDQRLRKIVKTDDVKVKNHCCLMVAFLCLDESTLSFLSELPSEESLPISREKLASIQRLPRNMRKFLTVNIKKALATNQGNKIYCNNRENYETRQLAKWIKRLREQYSKKEITSPSKKNRHNSETPVAKHLQDESPRRDVLTCQYCQATFVFPIKCAAHEMSSEHNPAPEAQAQRSLLFAQKYEQKGEHEEASLLYQALSDDPFVGTEAQQRFAQLNQQRLLSPILNAIQRHPQQSNIGNPNPPMYKCPHCTLVFFRQDLLGQHTPQCQRQAAQQRESLLNLQAHPLQVQTIIGDQTNNNAFAVVPDSDSENENIDLDTSPNLYMESESSSSESEMSDTESLSSESEYSDSEDSDSDYLFGCPLTGNEKILDDFQWEIDQIGAEAYALELREQATSLDDCLDRLDDIVAITMDDENDEQTEHAQLRGHIDHMFDFLQEEENPQPSDPAYTAFVQNLDRLSSDPVQALIDLSRHGKTNFSDWMLTRHKHNLDAAANEIADILGLLDQHYFEVQKAIQFLGRKRLGQALETTLQDLIARQS